MKLETLLIEQFGDRAQLKLEDVSDRLNVIYGPHGSGKTTLNDLVRWVLYGNADRHCDPYLHKAARRATGSLRISDRAGLRQTISRQDDGSAAGRISIQETNGAVGTAYHSIRLAEIDLEEYQTVYSIGFAAAPPIERLVQIGANRGFAPTQSSHHLARIREIHRLLELRRSEWNRHQQLNHSQHSLRERKESLLREIAQLETKRHQRQMELESKRAELVGEIEKRKGQLHRLQVWFGQIEQTIQTRRHQLEVAAQEAEQAKRTWMDSRRRKVEEIDYQIQQWHNFLDVIRNRYDDLTSKAARVDRHDQLGLVDDDSDLRYVLKSLGYRVDDMEADFVDQGYAGDERSATEHQHYMRSVLGSALTSMRSDVSRLCDELRRHKSHNMQQEYQNELRQLRRCETELGDLVESLTDRRHALLGDDLLLQADDPYWYENAWRSQADWRSDSDSLLSSDDYRSWNASHVDAYRPRDAYSHRDFQHADYSVVRPYHDYSQNGSQSDYRVTNGTVRHVDYESPVYLRSVDPVLEARLQHLYRRRDFVSARSREIELQIADLERQLALYEPRHADDHHRMEQLRRDIEVIERQLQNVTDVDRLQAEIRSLENELASLQSHTGHSELLDEASGIFRSLTGDTYSRLRLADNRELWVDDRSSRSLRYSQLNRGTQDQAYLALSMALASANRRRGIIMPMLIDDAFVHVDADRASLMAEVLMQFAEHGQQLLVFTSQEPVMRLFSPQRARLFTLQSQRQPEVRYVPPVNPVPPFRPEVRPEPVRVEPVRVEPRPEPIRPIVAEPVERTIVTHEKTYDWVARWDVPDKQTVEFRSSEPSIPLPTAPVVRTERMAPAKEVQEPAVEARQRLSLSSRLTQVETVDPEIAKTLSAADVVSVEHFLELDPQEGERLLTHLGIVAADVYKWQSEVSLQVFVGLSGTDACLLVACGVDDPEELSYADANDLHRRIEALLSDATARSQYGAISRYERSRLNRWTQWARQSRYKRNRDRWSRYSGNRRSSDRTKENRDAQSSARFVERSPRYSAISRSVREQRETHDIREADSRPVRGPETLRFYLEPSDPIVDAPSIGPKTADRFQTIGVTTVSEFLEMDASYMAERIDYRRITADMIREWQLQTRLVCQVPNLRGHDAQILVGCNVTSAELLAQQNEHELHKSVKRFCSTADGKRILRNGKQPDLTEITAWIRWAHSMRQLQAA
ncbi:MAG: DUF4332 domain-containing protein [Planctomycetales bacterium]|nr:DUF4332 domain-containing protein [Planctomycetales bacterium]